MNGNFREVLESIEKNTAVTVGIFDRNKRVIKSGGELTDYFPENLKEGVFCDKEKDRTFFTFSFEKESFVGVIKGSDKTSENYGFFISEMLFKDFGKEKKASGGEILKKILLGEDVEDAEIYAEKHGIKNEKCFVLLFSLSEDKLKGLYEVLNTFCLGAKDKTVVFDDKTVVYLKFTNKEDFKDYNSFYSFASFLSQAVFEEIGTLPFVFIGGEVKNIFAAHISLKQALTAREICLELGEKGNIHSYKDFLPYEMLKGIPKVELGRYLDSFLNDAGVKILNDAEIADTAAEFLENNLNISETARKLYLHRNTLMYRLDKIEKATGLDLRKFNDAVIFKVITYLLKITK